MEKEYYCSHCGKKNVLQEQKDIDLKNRVDIKDLKADPQPDTHRTF